LPDYSADGGPGNARFCSALSRFFSRFSTILMLSFERAPHSFREFGLSRA
jgi:hypothetical protein